MTKAETMKHPLPPRPKPKRSNVVTARDIREAAAGLEGVATRTPLRYVDELGAHLKLEN